MAASASPLPDPTKRRPRESELAAPVERHLTSLGYRVWVDPDGSDYFDVVARRGEEVGLIELKLADWKGVLAQAVARRGWGSWTAVVVPRDSLGQRLLAHPRNERTTRVGIWLVRDGAIEVLRPATPSIAPGEDDPYGPLREEFRHLLDAMESGALPPNVGWTYLRGWARFQQGGRPAKSWSLDEFSP
ncbi:MAG: hypothetical protein WA549_03190 [Thermoplasmata archaeon]